MGKNKKNKKILRSEREKQKRKEKRKVVQ